MDTGIGLSMDVSDEIRAVEKIRSKTLMLTMIIAKPRGSRYDKVILEEDQFQLKVDKSVSEIENTKNAVKTLRKELANKDATNYAKPKYITMSFHSILPNGYESSKLLYICWVPDYVRMGDKMKFSSTKLINKFSSGPIIVYAGTLGEIDYDYLFKTYVRPRIKMSGEELSVAGESSVAYSQFWDYATKLAVLGFAFGCGCMLAQYKKQAQNVNYESLNIELA